MGAIAAASMPKKSSEIAFWQDDEDNTFPAQQACFKASQPNPQISAEEKPATHVVQDGDNALMLKETLGPLLK